MRISWARSLLALATAGFLVVLVSVAPSDVPSVALLTLVPLVAAGGLFGLRGALAFMAGLTAATVLVIELMGPGMDSVFGTYRGIPILMFVMIGLVVGRLRDLRTQIEKELGHRRRVELELGDTRRQLGDRLESRMS